MQFVIQCLVLEWRYEAKALDSGFRRNDVILKFNPTFLLTLLRIDLRKDYSIARQQQFPFLRPHKTVARAGTVDLFQPQAAWSGCGDFGRAEIERDEQGFIA